MNIQKVISDIVNTRKNQKLCQTIEIPGTQGAISDKVTPDIIVFTDEPVDQCDVQVLENTFTDDSK